MTPLLCHYIIQIVKYQLTLSLFGAAFLPPPSGPSDVSRWHPSCVALLFEAVPYTVHGLAFGVQTLLHWSCHFCQILVHESQIHGLAEVMAWSEPVNIMQMSYQTCKIFFICTSIFLEWPTMFITIHIQFPFNTCEFCKVIITFILKHITLGTSLQPAIWHFSVPS